jgi:hypothetical protein
VQKNLQKRQTSHTMVFVLREVGSIAKKKRKINAIGLGLDISVSVEYVLTFQYFSG